MNIGSDKVAAFQKYTPPPRGYYLPMTSLLSPQGMWRVSLGLNRI